MRLLAFLLLGTLIFGFAFPAAIIIIGLVAVVLFVVMIVGLFRGGGFRVYTNKGYDPFEGSRKKYTQDNPEVIDTTEHSDFEEDNNNLNQSVFDEEEEGEVVELPATALRKEN